MAQFSWLDNSSPRANEPSSASINSHLGSNHKKLSLEILNNVAKSRIFARMIYRLRATAGGLGKIADQLA